MFFVSSTISHLIATFFQCTSAFKSIAWKFSVSNKFPTILFFFHLKLMFSILTPTITFFLYLPSASSSAAWRCEFEDGRIITISTIFAEQQKKPWHCSAPSTESLVVHIELLNLQRDLSPLILSRPKHIEQVILRLFPILSNSYWLLYLSLLRFVGRVMCLCFLPTV